MVRKRTKFFIRDGVLPAQLQGRCGFPSVLVRDAEGCDVLDVFGDHQQTKRAFAAQIERTLRFALEKALARSGAVQRR